MQLGRVPGRDVKAKMQALGNISSGEEAGLLAYLVGYQIHVSASLDSADRVDKAHLQQHGPSHASGMQKALVTAACRATEACTSSEAVHVRFGATVPGTC